MHQHTRGILPVLGLDFDTFEPVYLDFAEGARALVEGTVDAQFQAPIPNPIMDELAQTTAVRAIPPDPEEIAAVVAAIPHYRRGMLRAGAFAGHEADSEQIGVLNVLVTHARVPDAAIAAVVTALLERTDRLMADESLFRGLDELFGEIRAEGLGALERHGIPVHPGAAQAYRSWAALP